jgi:hypothetical protein
MRWKGANGHLWPLAVLAPTLLLALVAAFTFGWIGGGTVSAAGLPAVIVGAQSEVGGEAGSVIREEGTAMQPPGVVGAPGATSTTGCTSAVAGSGGTSWMSSEAPSAEECRERETVAQPLRLHGARGAEGSSGSDEGRGRSR